jgi:transposase
VAILSLTPEEREQLESYIRQPKDHRTLPRAMALLSLDRGGAVSQVAAAAAVNRGTIYNWVRRFVEDRTEPIEARLRDKPRSGRPPKETSEVEGMTWNMEHSQRELRYLMKHHDMKMTHDEKKGWTFLQFLDATGEPFNIYGFQTQILKQLLPELTLDTNKKSPPDGSE